MPEGADRIVLVGFMGAGKSTVGPLVARRLGYGFEDMDELLVARAGKPIAAIFGDAGEEAFRAMETELARELGRRRRCVIAAGGGAFARPATRALLQLGALTVWLRCDLATVLARIPPGGSRPLAGDHDIMRALLAQREASYRTADLTVEAVGTPEQVAERIVALAGERLDSGAP